MMKITIIGNSVALRVRPPKNHPDNKNYTILLREGLKESCEVENKSIGATTIFDQVKIKDNLICSFPDLFIVNIGVVDATIREIPRWFNKKVARRTNNPIVKILNAFYTSLIKKNRPFFSLIRGRKSWVSTGRFEKEFDFFIRTLLKETNAQIIILPINLANERIEKQLPGSRKNHEKFNAIIQQVTEKYQQYFLDLSDLNSKDHYPDGVHFNHLGHKLVAEKLISLINEIDIKH